VGTRGPEPTEPRPHVNYNKRATRSGTNNPSYGLERGSIPCGGSIWGMRLGRIHPLQGRHAGFEAQMLHHVTIGQW